MTLRILIVDDQELFRAAIALMLSRDPRLSDVATASSGEAAIEHVRAHAVDVVLMDIRMPGMDGIAATREVRCLRPATRVLILTTFDLDEYVYAAIREGASGFLTKDASPAELADAAVAVAAGESVMSSRATEALIGFVRDGAPGADRRRRSPPSALASRRSPALSPPAPRTTTSLGRCSSRRTR